MKLTGKQAQDLHEALCAAYPTEARLERMLRFQLNARLPQIAKGEDLEQVVYEVIKWAEAQGLIKKLIKCASRENPNSRKLRKLSEQIKSDAKDEVNIQELNQFAIPLARTPIAGGPLDDVLEELRVSSNVDKLYISGNHLGRHVAHASSLYALRVKGSSMIGRDIDDGDIVIICKDSTVHGIPQPGQIVVAYVKGVGATLKIYRPESNGRIRLESANRDYPTIYTNMDDLTLQGIVVYAGKLQANLKLM
jgi:SOS-response transcriptional repressor LexA